MSYYTNVMTDLVSSCSTSGAALAAGIPLVEWTSSTMPHVMTSTDFPTADFNKGRLPVILINRTSNAYTQINPAPEGGEIISSFDIKIIVKKTRKGEKPAEEVIFNIWDVIWNTLKNDTDFGVSSFSIGDTQQSFMTFSNIFTITVNHSH